MNNRRSFHVLVLSTMLLLLPTQGKTSPTEKNTARLKSAASVRPAGYGPALETRTGTLNDLRAVRIALPLAEPGCFRIAVAAEKEIEDISLAVYRGSTELARDRLSGKRPAVNWCTAEAGGVEAEVSAYGGQGAFALALFRKKGAAAPPGRMKAGGADNDLIANRIRQLAPHYAPEKRPFTAVLRGTAAGKKSVDFSVRLTGRCVAILAAHAPELLGLEATLEGPSGAASVSAQSSGSFTIIRTETPCPPAGVYTLRIRATRGLGTFGLQLFSD